MRGIEISSIKIASDVESLIKDTLSSGISSIIHIGKHMGMRSSTLTTRFTFFNAKHPTIPTQGLGFQIEANWRANLKDTNRQLLMLGTELKFYNRLVECNFFQSVNIRGRENYITILPHHPQMQNSPSRLIHRTHTLANHHTIFRR